MIQRNSMSEANIVKLDESKLWTNFKQGEETAFAFIFRTYYESMFNYGKKFHKDSELIEDCIQELFLEIWKNRANLADIDNIKPYLLTAIRRKIIKQLDKNLKIKKLFSNNNEKEYKFEITFSYETELINAQSDQEKIQQLQEKLDKLPPRQKEILYLLFYQDMSYEEVSQIMGINYQSARNLVHRAIKMLRENEQ
ncbi:RNA polymerase sigma factor, sigma-70 family [Thermoflexibacter ruber]|uniref:RNA polymerase sigma factor, sigma-70 family n=2 Tax=Thermoflexibacter ruber TaxID=1003 RepID=A0A1I2IE87_9BACT|nr:RNA polymerase sigma factor, sigma-70 family [Thermoflexibacter ruber]